LQLVSIIENNLINKLNTIYKKVVSRKSIYTKKDFFCLLYLLSSISNSAYFVCCQIYRALFVLLAVKHIELVY